MTGLVFLTKSFLTACYRFSTGTRYHAWYEDSKLVLEAEMSDVGKKEKDTSRDENETKIQKKQEHLSFCSTISVTKVYDHLQGFNPNSDQCLLLSSEL